MDRKIICGECFPWAYRFQRKSGGTLVHGMVTHPWDKNTFPHAWVEKGGKVYDWQTIEMRKGKPISVSEFKKTWSSKSTSEFTKDDSLMAMTHTKHYGPWEESDVESKVSNDRIAKELLVIASLVTGAAFDAAKIQQFRKDFLKLMKNTKVVKNYDQAKEWQKHVGKWSNRFEEYIYRYLIENTLKDMKVDDKIGKREEEYWESRIRSEVWPFTVGFRVPFDADLANDFWTEEQRFDQFQKKLNTWDRSIRGKAQKAWNVLKEFTDWYERLYEKTLDVGEPVVEQMNIEGFDVIMKVPPDSFVNPRDVYQKLKKALSIVKSGAAKYAPKLLKMKVPIVVDLTQKGLDNGGEWKRGKVYVYTTSFYGNNIKGLAHVIAHEFAHALYKHVDSDRWESFISGNYGKLDLRDVLKQYGSQLFLHDNDLIRKRDPMLYLQIGGLYHNPYTKHRFENLLTMDSLRENLDDGGEPVVTVQGKPISGYAGKMPSEAFPEAVGLLVTYGKKALIPDVYNVLTSLL